MLRSCVLIFFLFVSVSRLFSQEPGSFINEKGFNVKYLEFLLKKQIDSVREAHDLDPLINDSILYLAAKDHADYLLDAPKLTHFQRRDKNKYSPQERSEYYGAEDYAVGENIVLSYLDADLESDYISGTYRNETYEDAAKNLMLAWVNSPGHYANIITSAYDITALAISYDPKVKAVYAVQVFADVTQAYNCQDFPSSFPYENLDEELKRKKFIEKTFEPHHKHAHKIKKDLKHKCCDDSKTLIFNANTIYLDYREDTVCLNITKRSKASIKNFFRDKNDGLILEFPHFGYLYTCDAKIRGANPSRMNGGCIFDGIVTEPIYTDSLKKLFAEAWKKPNGDIQIPLGVVPDKVKTEKYEVNLLILQEKRLCKVIGSQGLCGSILESPLPQLSLYSSLESKLYNPKPPPIKFEQKVYFQKNKTSALEKDALEIIAKQIKADDLFVKRINVSAFASVEGKVENNEMLFKRRADAVMELFQNYQDSAIDLSMQTEENWKLFRTQIEQNNLQDLAQMDSVDLKEYINKNDEAYEYLLAKQRYGMIEILAVPKITEENKDEIAIKNIEKYSRLKKPNPIQKYKLLNAYSYLLEEYHKKGSKDEFFGAYDLPKGKDYDALKYEAFIIGLMNNYNIGMDFPTKLKYLADAQKNLKSTESRYNYLAFKCNNRFRLEKDLSISEIDHLINLMRDLEVSEDTINQILLFKHFKTANSSLESGRGAPGCKLSLSFIHDYYFVDSITDERRLLMAYYFLLFDQYERSTTYLEPIIDQNTFYGDRAYKLYLKLYDQLQIMGKRSSSETQLMEALDRLTTEDWCNLFMGPCNIRSSIFTHEPLRRLYCETCRDK